MVVASSNHVLLDERAVAWIGDSGVKVLEVVRDKLAHGHRAEEMHFQYPHLSLAQTTPHSRIITTTRVRLTHRSLRRTDSRTRCATNSATRRFAPSSSHHKSP